VAVSVERRGALTLGVWPLGFALALLSSTESAAETLEPTPVAPLVCTAGLGWVERNGPSKWCAEVQEQHWQTLPNLQCSLH